MSFGLNGCDINDEDATHKVMFDEGLSFGVEPDDSSIENFHGDDPATNSQIDIWFDRCPASRCGDGPTMSLLVMTIPVLVVAMPVLVIAIPLLVIAIPLLSWT